MSVVISDLFVIVFGVHSGLAQRLESLDDPVAVYDAVAPSFALLTAERRAYLDVVDRLVIAHAPAETHRLLDVGAGDSRRGRLIADALKCDHLVLLEPSSAMRSLVSSSDYVDLRVEELSRLEGSFDVIVCLWNVIGHVFPQAARVEAMRQFHRLLRPGGRVFVDVAHRYNAARYGAVRTAGRWLYDHVAPSDTHGDVTASWNLAGREYNVRGHVFTHREFAGMASAAGLVIARRIVVDYDSGAECSFGFQGNLVYIMERPS